MKGRIYKSTGSWYLAKSGDGIFWNARLRGSFRQDGITSTNPVVVGDEVELEVENADDLSAMITAISDRKNYIIRQSPSHKMHQHILATNIDRSLLIVSLKNPKISQGFIDRFLVTCEAYYIPAVVVVNKSDIYGKKELAQYQAWREMYTAIGYPILLISVNEKLGLDPLKELLQNKVTAVNGPSGVGKSSFVNHIFPDMHQKTQDVSGWSGKGMHTTSFAEMFDLPQGGQLIDTPGIREFGLVDISKQELSHYFPEMRDRLQNCQFNNCLHTDEPGCAIKKALQEGELFEDRYISYRKILDTIIEERH